VFEITAGMASMSDVTIENGLSLDLQNPLTLPGLLNFAHVDDLSTIVQSVNLGIVSSGGTLPGYGGGVLVDGNATLQLANCTLSGWDCHYACLSMSVSDPRALIATMSGGVPRTNAVRLGAPRRLYHTASAARGRRRTGAKKRHRRTH
jgi:hypothetical protein